MDEVFHVVRASRPSNVWLARGLFFVTPFPGGFLEMHAVSHEYRIIRNEQYFPPDLHFQHLLLDRPRWSEALHTAQIEGRPSLRAHFAAHNACANWFMTRQPGTVPDHSVLHACRTAAVAASQLAQAQPLTTATALSRGILCYMPFPPGQGQAFTGYRLDAVRSALTWLSAHGSQDEGIVIAGYNQSIFSITWTAGTVWVLDLIPCAGLRGDVERAMLWVAFDTADDALHFLRWKYPRDGPWDGFEFDSLYAWATAAAPHSR